MLDCIERIEEYAAPGYPVFEEETLRQDAIMRNLEVIIETILSASEK